MIKRDFIRVAETSNTFRFKELPAVDQAEAVGTIYIKKSVYAELGDPDRIRVAIESLAILEAAKAGGTDG